MKFVRTTPVLLIALAVSAVLISACGVASAAAPENQASDAGLIEASPDFAIVVEGNLMPREAVDLSFGIGGEVVEILVEEGDQVEAGDVLARLGNREPLEAAIAGAELELYNAQQALDKLYDDLEIVRAAALQTVSQANQEVRDAQYQFDIYTVSSDQRDLTPLEAVEKMKAALDEARQAYEPYKYASSSDSTRERLLDELEEARSDYNAAIRRMEYEAELVSANARLAQAMADYEALQDGPDAELIEAAEVRIAAAEVSLEAAQAALDDLEVKTTISGTVVSADLIAGQQVSPGQIVLSIADFSEWYVETDDLTEIDVVSIEPGQKVTIVADALPDVQMTGTVVSISQVSEEKRGDITYTVKILVEDADARLRWGMTLAVTFED